MGYAATRPAGGVIEEQDDWDGRRLSWPLPRGGFTRFFAAAFLGCWLCGWAVGWAVVANQLATGQDPGGARLFMMAWLAGWTVGGGAAAWSLWAMVRPGRPESVTLGAEHLDYDPGRMPTSPFLQGRWGSWPGPATPAAPARLKGPVRVAKGEIRKFVVDRVGERQRLSFDWGAKRVEIGATLDEPEREWLQDALEGWRVG